jgi:hypothetical protein
MQKTLQSIREAAEKVKAGKPGATGLIPLGNLRDGGDVLSQHRVTIRDQLKGNRAGIFAQSGKGKTNLVKVVLFWTAFNPTYGKLVFDYKGEYVPWTQNERGEDVPGLCEHPLASERVVLYTTKARHLEDDALDGKIKMRALKVHLRSILPRDFALFWPNLTNPQREFLYAFDEDSDVYDTILGEEKEWPKNLSTWFGEDATQKGKPDHSAKVVVRSIRKKLQAMQNRPYIIDTPRINKQVDGSLALRAPFNEEFKEALKNRTKAQWNPNTRTWVVDECYEDILKVLIEEHYAVSYEPDSLEYIIQDLAEGKLVVIDFSGIVSEADRDLIATLINRRLFEYNLERIDLDEGKDGRIPLVVFFEEAQNLLGSDKVRDNKNSIFVRTFKEGRALSIGTTTITQQPGALAKELTSQMAYYIIQHLRSREDVRELVAMDPALAGAEVDIARRVPGNALYVDNDRGFPLSHV